MSQQKPIKLSIQIESEDGAPINIKSIQINDQVFVPENQDDEYSPDTEDEEKVSIDIPLATTAIVPEVLELNTEGQHTIPVESVPQTQAQKPLQPSADFNTLEEFGGNSFYRMFWGKLSYTKLNDSQTTVSYEGGEDVFDASFVGKWLEPSRIHKCALDFPETGRNYFPGALAVVYSRVIEVIDGKHLIVDFAYNGGNASSPKTATNQDGIFFFDNKLAINSWSGAAMRKDVLKANAGQIYACLGMPRINVKQDSTLNFAGISGAEQPAIHLMMSDAFNGDKDGKGEGVLISFKETFGENYVFFDLPSQGKVSIDFDWQFIPPTYSQKVVQYGVPDCYFFYDKAAYSQQYGLKRVSNKNQFRIRDAMKKALGFVRPGVAFSMPNQGYCNGGGIHDGREIKEFCTYRFEGNWLGKNPNNMKARTSGGLRVEWIGESKENPGNFIEMESLKAYRFDELKFKFLSNASLEVDDPNFTWYHLASQEWTGGNSTGYEASSLRVNGKTIGLNTNGDFWLVYGDEDVASRGLSAHRLSFFDKIPKPGDIISQDLQDIKKNSLIAKLSDTNFEVWGWAIQEGDQLSYAGKNFTVKKTERKWKTWEQFAAQYSNPPERLKRADRKITYTEIELNQPVSASLAELEFQVVKGGLTACLDGKEISGCSAVWNFGNDAPGHLMYIDYNVNLIMKDVRIHGMIRSTSKPLWAETSTALSGNISSIPVGPLGATIWKRGDKLQLADPESGLVTEVELITDFSGNAGKLLIKPIKLSGEFPAQSILTALYSLCQEASFENVNFVEEDLRPCYSERIDYRPQGLRLRQMITKNDSCRVKINGGRISWYSNLDNRFEPEVEITNHPHMINPKSVVPVLLNPVVSDKKGIHFGYQYKQAGEAEIFVLSRVVVRDGKEIDLSNSVLGSDLYLEGNGDIVLNGLKSENFIDNGRDTGVGFNLVVQDKFMATKSLELKGQNGKAGLMVNTAYPTGALKIDFKKWELIPALFNNEGFQSKQNKNDARYSDFVKISDS
ncbi:hypothetical protein [Algoriphagus chordae]|uniref:Uncharacterized protein n=1 Tax=Algoriphagus chordae TaxID=237019 RepID=A0A2W7RLR4_9BACT|nr:hypothetical protein [Algoriphagus chordae]PZX56487.1 hypothetical protein LV85_00411 [Algoriphagus chordae]